LLAYADWWIRKEILDELNNLGVVTVPVHKQKALRRELKKNQYICLQCGVRVDDLTKVSQHTPCTANEHEFIPAANESEVLSPVINMDTVTLVSTVDVEDSHLSRETRETIRGIVYGLPFRERDRFILLRYFDLVGDERCAGQKSLHKVASVLGITPERVRQIKESSLGLLRKELRRMDIHDLSALRMS
jgi:RNA polymerase sigma factor (sigma-70 family)